MKYAWIENHRDEYRASRLCRVLSVSRSGYCQWRVRSPSARTLANQSLDTKVAAIVDWIEGFYNHVRLHTTIGCLAPVTKERSLLAT